MNKYSVNSMIFAVLFASTSGGFTSCGPATPKMRPDAVTDSAASILGKDGDQGANGNVNPSTHVANGAGPVGTEGPSNSGEDEPSPIPTAEPDPTPSPNPTMTPLPGAKTAPSTNNLAYQQYSFKYGAVLSLFYCMEIAEQDYPGKGVKQSEVFFNYNCSNSSNAAAPNQLFAYTDAPHTIYSKIKDSSGNSLCLEQSGSKLIAVACDINNLKQRLRKSSGNTFSIVNPSNPDNCFVIPDLSQPFTGFVPKSFTAEMWNSCSSSKALTEQIFSTYGN